MHFTGYQPEATGTKEFCEDIPETGHTVVALDAIDEQLRHLPIEVRIIRDTGDESNIDAVTVLHLKPKTYPTGSLSLEHDFPQPGRFVGLVTAVGDKETYVSRFPFSVASTSAALAKYVPMVGVVLAGILLYLYSGQRRGREARKTRGVGPKAGGSTS
ncbi:hypothetical protein [Azoarcus sp. DD4]|uniref:hypothetical protein n=1 Tax=Azoarcus sp. DD4 TaxID=2027405 RepID=UPI00197AE20A|nr:hypothetical protein [Azoarcus sp. DD4]